MIKYDHTIVSSFYIAIRKLVDIFTKRMLIRTFFSSFSFSFRFVMWKFDDVVNQWYKTNIAGIKEKWDAAKFNLATADQEAVHFLQVLPTLSVRHFSPTLWWQPHWNMLQFNKITRRILRAHVGLMCKYLAFLRQWYLRFESS